MADRTKKSCHGRTEAMYISSSGYSCETEQDALSTRVPFTSLYEGP